MTLLMTCTVNFIKIYAKFGEFRVKGKKKRKERSREKVGIPSMNTKMRVTEYSYCEFDSNFSFPASMLKSRLQNTIFSLSEAYPIMVLMLRL